MRPIPFLFAMLALLIFSTVSRAQGGCTGNVPKPAITAGGCTGNVAAVTVVHRHYGILARIHDHRQARLDARAARKACVVVAACPAGQTPAPPLLNPPDQKKK